MAYTPLRISTVKPGLDINFDLFIHFKGQYLRYFEGGNILEEEQYKKLRKQKIAKFFIDEKDELNYQNFLDNLLNNTLDSDSVSVEEKVNLVEGACSTAIERMQENPTSKSAYNMTEIAAQSLKKVINGNPESLKAIFEKEVSEDDVLIKHSLNVSALATKMGAIFELTEDEISNLAMAGMIHDIGLTINPEGTGALFKKYKKDLTHEDKKVYDQHVKQSLDVLQDKEYMNPKILKLVKNHEETLSGTGPYKITKLSKSELILSMVDTYDKLMITKKLSPREAMGELMIEELGNYDLDYLKKFKSVLNKEGLLES